MKLHTYQELARDFLLKNPRAGHARHHKLDHLGSPCDCPCIRLGGDAP